MAVKMTRDLGLRNEYGEHFQYKEDCDELTACLERCRVLRERIAAYEAKHNLGGQS